MRKSINAKELIAERYGKEGSKEREEFTENAFSYYFGEIIKNENKMNLFDEENDWREHWKGTLSFNQENKKPIQKITVSFENNEDVQKFAELTGYKITEKTKSIWFPFREKDKPREYAWIDSDKKEEDE